LQKACVDAHGLTPTDGPPHHRRVTMKSVETESDVAAAVALFRGLADPARLAIVQHLALGEHRVADLTAHLGLAQSTTSQHLACLRDCGLVVARAEGRASYYSLARPELLDLLTAAEKLLTATGETVALCPTYGRPA
jgi:DNA-binding transcriptional ArsR family regulator